MKPEVSIPVALATGAVVVGVYQAMSPSNADTRTVEPGSTGAEMLAGSERTALFVAVGVCGGISLIAKDPIPFVVGGLLAVALSWSHRYATNVNPGTNRLGTAAGALTGARYTVQAAG
jgi:hypothetical protein